MREALRVWVKWTNAQGGVSGHPVSAIFADDGGDPARHRAAVQKMVEQDKVVAFVADALDSLVRSGRQLHRHVERWARDQPCKRRQDQWILADHQRPRRCRAQRPRNEPRDDHHVWSV